MNKFIVTACMGALIACASIQAFSQTSTSCSTVFNPKKCYLITNKKSGRVLDVFQVYKDDNVRVIQFNYNGGGNQNWHISPTGTGNFIKLTAQHSGKNMGTTTGDLGAQVFQLSSNNTSALRQWTIECVGSTGYYRIVHQSGKVLDVQGATIENAANTVLSNWTGTNNDNQLWRIAETTCAPNDNDLNALPVFDIEAQADFKRNKIAFTTNFGFLTDFFTIEKKNEDKGIFETLETINNTQPDNSLQFHSIFDTKPNIGYNSYRIKATYLTGECRYTAIKKVKYNKYFDFEIFPNPARSEAWIDLSNFEGLTVRLLISDLVGQPFFDEIIEKATVSPHHLSLNNLPAGLYLVKMQANGKRVVIRKLEVMR
jgi:hypothetical protein